MSDDPTSARWFTVLYRVLATIVWGALAGFLLLDKLKLGANAAWLFELLAAALLFGPPLFLAVAWLGVLMGRVRLLSAYGFTFLYFGAIAAMFWLAPLG